MNPLTDFAFKKLFGDPSNKEILIDFINAVLQENTPKITDLVIMNSEQLGQTEKERMAVYDLYCTNETGDHVVVEIQRVPQAHFIDRTVYYSSFLIQKQGVKGSAWNYELKSIYVISLLNFAIQTTEMNRDEYYHKAKLMEVTGQKIFYDKLTFVYLELPKFKKQVKQLNTHFEKWVWLFGHMETLNEIPEPLTEPIFMKLLDKAKLEKLQPYELSEYETTLKTLRDNHNAMQYAIETGLKEGLKEGFEKGEAKGLAKGELKRAIETAKIAHAEGLPLPLISKLTGLSEAELQKLFKKD
jgi:predicted transposase/invertase (TIGR01784 family)